MGKLFTYCFLALAACLPGLAGAQVAVTDLAPAAVRYAQLPLLGFNSANFTADNPATLLWGENTRLGAGGLRLESTDNQSEAVSEFSGIFLGGRFVFTTLAFGLEHVATESDARESDIPLVSFDESITNVHVAVKALNWLSLGLSRFSSTIKDAAGSTTLDGFTLGASLNLGGWFFLGAGMGADALIKKFPDGTGVSSSRDTRMYGMGIRTNGDTRVYLEVYTLLNGDFDNLSVPPDPDIPDGRYTATTGAFQVIAWSMLFGAAYTTIDIENGASEAEIVKFDLGYAPSDGLSITLRLLRMEEISAAAPDVVIQNITSSVAISYLF